jgi:hypothetical protein
VPALFKSPSQRRRTRLQQKPRILIVAVGSYRALPAARFFKRRGLLVEVQPADTIRHALRSHYDLALIVGRSEADTKRIGTRLRRTRAQQDYILLSPEHLSQFIASKHKHRRRPKKLLRKLINFISVDGEQGVFVGGQKPSMDNVLAALSGNYVSYSRRTAIQLNHDDDENGIGVHDFNHSDWQWRIIYALIYLAALAISITKGVLSFDLLAVAVLICCLLNLRRAEQGW